VRDERKERSMNGYRRWTGVAVVSILLGTVACSSSASSGPPATPKETGQSSNNIAVDLKQWSVTPSTTPGLGSVTFTVSNDGTIPHEFVVLKTDTPAADIPIGKFEGEPGRINEDTAGTNVGETGDMQPGTTKTVTIDLAPGHYVFLCNLPGHFQSGMHFDVTVS
jgi:uncharacterized cupredoxin-like copper-binding protein